MTIGFIGLGTMGAPMAANLVRAGQHVRVWNRSPGPVAALVARGAEAAATPAQAADAGMLFSMLADDAATRMAVLEGGCLDALAAGAVHVNMATVSVAFACEMAALHAQRGIGYVAGPVLGRPDIAAAGTLNILAAGPGALIDRVQPLLDAIGQKTWRFGERPEQANAVKLAANFMIASAIEAMAEASTLAAGFDVPAAAFLDMIAATLFAAPVYKGYGALIAERRFVPAGFRMTLGLKEIRLALEAAEAAHVPLPFGGVLKDNLLDGIAHGGADSDWAALAQVAVRRAGQG
jgi:hypothetical protein